MEKNSILVKKRNKKIFILSDFKTWPMSYYVYCKEQMQKKEEEIMTNTEIALCNGIIHTASLAAGAVGAGLAQVPCSDNLLITPIQLTMAVSLGKVFDIDLDQSAAKAAVASAASATVGRAVSQVLAGWIPGVGNFINAATAASFTEAVGWIMAYEFERQSLCEMGGAA